MTSPVMMGTFAEGQSEGNVYGGNEPYREKPGKGEKSGQQIRQECEQLRGQLENERASFISHWKDIADFVLPRRARFQVTDVNKGDRRNQKIIDGTATEAAGTLAAGMQSGVTNPARPWFRLTTPDPALAEQDDVKEWLYDVQTRMEAVLLKSNVYDILPIAYQDLGTFGTCAIGVFEDDEDVIRCYDFPLGTFSAANDHKLRVRTFIRTFRLTVQQVVEKWGNLNAQGVPDFEDGRDSSISYSTQNLWKRKGGGRQAWVDLVHMVGPNNMYDGEMLDSKYKPFMECYYEVGTAPTNSKNGLLQHTGYDEFPILVGRWEKNSEDVYGTNCPGMRALGDIKQLQTLCKRIAQAMEKQINPPVTGPAALQNTKVSVLPGDITYSDVRDQQAGLRPVYQVTFDYKGAQLMKEELRRDIKHVFKEDLFLMLASSDRREITAREVEERHEEKLLAIGPVLTRIDNDILDGLIERVYNRMTRVGLIPEAPESIQGVSLKVEYISILFQALKQVTLGGLDRTAGFVGQMAQVDPSILDRVDFDELIKHYADAAGAPPKIIRTDDEVNQIRQARAEQAQQQQAAQNIPALAGAAKDMASSPTDGNNLLSKFVEAATARRTIGATAGPPQRVM